MDVQKIFLHTIKTTSDTKLRWFQYRLMYRILPTQKYLYKMKIVNSPTCLFCNIEEDSIVHMLWDCSKVQCFWNKFVEWIKENFPHCSQVCLSKELIILGKKNGFYSDKVFDLLILIGKYYVYCCKVKNTVPNINVFLHIARRRFKVERQIAISKGVYHKFVTTWSLYFGFFDRISVI